MPHLDTTYRQRFDRLETLLLASQWLWRPQPYIEERPAWTRQLPELTASLLALHNEQLYSIMQNPGELLTLLGKSIPALTELKRLCATDKAAADSDQAFSPFIKNHIPGRKWQQIEAFARCFTPGKEPILEWCGGKGHLGRVLAAQYNSSVHTLEWNPQLCDEGTALARQADLRQHFSCRDVLESDTREQLAGHHPVALHACGELHRDLLIKSVAIQVKALDIVPCCYHLLGEDDYRPFCRNRRLQLSRTDRKLAVTETVTAIGREIKQRDREMAWKLAYQKLRAQHTADPGYHPIKPFTKDWLRGSFAEFCQRLAERESLVFEASTPWQQLEEYGWRRQGEVMRLSLPRYAFRRALEMWMLLDMVCYLQEQDYEVRLEEFCDTRLTPRNLLICARHKQ